MGPEKLGKANKTGRVAYWQNNGWTLTGHGNWRSRKAIRAIPGKHFLEAAFDESAETATNVFLATLADGLFGTNEGLDAPEWNSHDVEFD